MWFVILSILVILCVIISDDKFNILFSDFISLISIFIDIGFWLVKGLLYIISLGLRVIEWVKVVWCVILFDNLDGIKFCVLWRFIVCNFIRIISWIKFLLSWVCLCKGKVILLNIDILVNKVLFWKSIFILVWVV